jgi:hypothetical protein
VIGRKWSAPPLPSLEAHTAIQTFLSLEQSTLEAHAFLASSTSGLFTHSTPDQNPASGVPALTELDMHDTPGKTILVSEDVGSAVSDIRITDSLIATVNGGEVSVFRKGDLVRISFAKQKLGCDRVTIPTTHGGNLLVHAGPSGIYLRDLDEASLKLVDKIQSPVISETCLSLDATQTSVYAGISGKGLFRINMETSEIISNINNMEIFACKMWSADGRMHLFTTKTGMLMWDTRSKTDIPIIEGPKNFPRSFSFSHHSSNLVAVATDRECIGIDIRKQGRVWELESWPMFDMAMSDNIVTLFSSSSGWTKISAYDLTYSPTNPTRIGEHSIPYKVSSVGFSCGNMPPKPACVFAVQRPKRSGRGDNGILCVGGSAFVAKKTTTCTTSSNNSSNNSTPNKRPALYSRGFSRNGGRF